MLRTGAEGDGDNLGCLPASGRGCATAATAVPANDLEAELETVEEHNASFCEFLSGSVRVPKLLIFWQRLNIGLTFAHFELKHVLLYNHCQKFSFLVKTRTLYLTKNI